MIIREAISDMLTCVGRIIFSLVFIVAGLQKLLLFTATVTYMNDMGFIFATPFTIAAIVIELGGGILILLGWYTRLACVFIFLFVLAVSFLVHHFWTLSGQAMEINLQSFLKNVAIMGGALYIFVFGPGGLFY